MSLLRSGIIPTSHVTKSVHLQTNFYFATYLFILSALNIKYLVPSSYILYFIYFNSFLVSYILYFISCLSKLISFMDGHLWEFLSCFSSFLTLSWLSCLAAVIIPTFFSQNPTLTPTRCNSG